jgi:hypothetical protein
MRFYHGAAAVLLGDNATAARVRRLISASWRPPGIDLVGVQEFQRTFGFLLRVGAFHQRLVGLDRLLDELPGLQGMSLMRQWLTTNGAGV